MKLAAPLQTDGAFTPGLIGTANGGGDAGTWVGMFHGPATAEADTMPSAITGQFGASFVNGTAVGGFGATKK